MDPKDINGPENSDANKVEAPEQQGLDATGQGEETFRLNLEAPLDWGDQLEKEKDAVYWLLFPFFNLPERRVRFFFRMLMFIFTFLIFAFIFGGLFSLLGPDATKGSGLASFKGRFPMSLAMISTYWLVSRFIDRRTTAGMGLSFKLTWWKDLAFGLALGVFLMAGIFAFEYAMGWVKVTGSFHPGADSSFVVGIICMVLMFIGVAFDEELFSRGYLLRNMAEGFNLLPGTLSASLALAFGVVFSSSLFGVGHMGNPNSTWVSTVNIILAGFLLALGYLLTKSLAIPIGFHFTWNFFQGNVFGFPVSGTDAGATFIRIDQGGPTGLTGGAFGPEAGLIGVVAMVLGGLLTWGYVRWSRGSAKIELDLAIYDREEVRKSDRAWLERFGFIKTKN